MHRQSDQHCSHIFGEDPPTDSGMSQIKLEQLIDPVPALPQDPKTQERLMPRLADLVSKLLRVEPAETIAAQ